MWIQQAHRKGPRAQNPWGPLRRFPQGGIGRLVCLLPLLIFLSSCRSSPRLRVVVRESTPVLDVAARELAARLESGGYRIEIATGPEASAGQINSIILSVDASAPGLQAEGFRITPIRAGGFLLLRVVGVDPRGVLWGSQELAEEVIVAGRPEAVSEQTANRRLPIRATALPLLLPDATASPEARAEARDHWRDRWRDHLDVLSRSRFNTIFFLLTQPVSRFAGVAGKPDESRVSAAEVRANIEWLRDLFRMAQERGLDCYLWLTRAALEGWLPQSGPSSTAAEPAAAPGGGETPASRESLPVLLRSYPELAGVALDQDVLTLAEPPERSRWVSENILAPLAQLNDQRAIFLSADREWWPTKDELSSAVSSSTIRLLAPLPLPAESPRTSDYPVLWRLETRPSELHPWEDPSAVRGAVQRIGTPDSLGFLDESFRATRLPSRNRDAEAGSGLPALEEDWFRLLLWGRLGYSPDTPDQYWRQQFAVRFGGRAGLAAYAAATHSSRILTLLPGNDASSEPPMQPGLATNSLPASAREFLFIKSVLFQSVSGQLPSILLSEVLSEKNWLLANEGTQREKRVPAGIMESEARQVLDEAANAGRLGAWRGTANEDFHRRIQAVAEAGLALAEYRRGMEALARFVLNGEETARQQALEHWKKVQETIAARASQGSLGNFHALDRLQPRLPEAIELIPKLKPWQWMKTNWEVGTVEGWQPASTADAPVPAQWMPVETSWLAEFGSYGQQPWVAALNQQLRPAYLTLPKELPLAPGTLLIARTRIPTRAAGRLVLRLVSDQPATVWVNRRRAVALSPQRFPWVAASPTPLPLRAQLFSQEVTSGTAEVIFAVPSAPTNWPTISLHSLFVPDARTVVSLAARQATQLEGGVVFVPGTEVSPQPHLALAEPIPSGTPATTPSGSPSHAQFRFSVAEPGFYRFRLWLSGAIPQSAGLDLFLDGSVLKQAVGRGDPISGMWHWLSVDTIADLGPGEHHLGVSGWKPGARLGIVEIIPQAAVARTEQTPTEAPTKEAGTAEPVGSRNPGSGQREGGTPASPPATVAPSAP
ncbi:MAG: hypothetical protein A3H28_00690 [Acidobacteria bacterium RIFCSPLOWO2_02_FULL_61_28]|nr:MAG: hypothetical protein A3H28_00690 [Acidobacteria bacterium RIFCSPLOWO2_02_FULL_61_28]